MIFCEQSWLYHGPECGRTTDSGLLHDAYFTPQSVGLPFHWRYDRIVFCPECWAQYAAVADTSRLGVLYREPSGWIIFTIFPPNATNPQM